MKLEEFKNIRALHFDIPQRQVAIKHEENAGPITAAINSLRLNSSLITTKNKRIRITLICKYSGQRKENTMAGTYHKSALFCS